MTGTPKEQSCQAVVLLTSESHWATLEDLECNPDEGGMKRSGEEGRAQKVQIEIGLLKLLAEFVTGKKISGREEKKSTWMEAGERTTASPPSSILSRGRAKRNCSKKKKLTFAVEISETVIKTTSPQI